MTPDELVEDSESIGCLESAENAPVPRKRSLIHMLKFPPQDYKLAPGAAEVPRPARALVRYWKLTTQPEHSNCCAAPASPARRFPRRSFPAALTTIRNKEWLS
jgi:hypothetical protein